MMLGPFRSLGVGVNVAVGGIGRGVEVNVAVGNTGRGVKVNVGVGRMSRGVGVRVGARVVGATRRGVAVMMPGWVTVVAGGATNGGGATGVGWVPVPPIVTIA